MFETDPAAVPRGDCLRRAAVYFSPSRAAARASAAVVCFFGMAASISGETPRIPPRKGLPPDSG